MSRLAPFLAAALAAAAVVPAAHADDDVVVTPEHREANALYKEGVRLFRNKDYAGALDLFQRAWQTFPAARVAYSLATTLKQMGRTVEAANWYQRFIDDPSAEPQLVSDARTVLRILDETVGRVDVSTGGAPAEVQIGDGAWEEVRDHELVRVAAGSVVVRGRRPGQTAEATAQIGAGTEQAITLPWTEAAPAHAHHAPPPPAAPPPPSISIASAPDAPPGRTRRIAAIASAGGGVALAGTALLLLHESSVHVDRETAIVQRDGSMSPAANAEFRSASLDRDLALASGGAAVLAVAAGTYLWLTAPRAHVHLTPLADDHAVGLLFTGRF